MKMKSQKIMMHISFDDILSGWKFDNCHESLDEDGIIEHSVGRITSWGGHYIATIHSDVPEDEREIVARFIAESPDIIKNLVEQRDREGVLIQKMASDISRYKRKINNLTQKLRSKKTK